MALTSPSHAFSYDVFLSFRGPDTRLRFTGNLYKALDDRGIHTFFDDEELRSGEEITSTLLKAIEGSRIAIVVLSDNYAHSSFCLDELAYILECRERKGLLALPVFYNLEPSQVRHQKGSYGEALAKHEKRLQHGMEKLHGWKMALREVTALSGFHFKDGDKYEYKFIGSIVERVSKEINPTRLRVLDYTVGLGSQVQEVRKLLDVGSDDVVHMIGIHGMGGIGKTTLVQAVYNLIAGHFDGSCFLGDVREKSNKYGLEHLQSILLREILGEKEINLTSVQQGASMIQHRLQRKKVLLILDDVDKLKQLQTLAGGLDWFGPGSRVIITTRDEQLLKSHQFKRRYEVKELNDNDALQLLTWKAFKKEKVDPIYVEVLDDVVTYASGLPLVLEVIGSSLYGKSIKVWESAIQKYKRIPKNEILEVLKVSFEALEEEEKKVFLDIACCLKGCELTEVERILYALYDYSTKHHIDVLVDKSLIKVWSGVVKMHNLIQDMGRQIDKQKSPEEPGKRWRLWLPEDIILVLKDNTGTSENKNKIICLDFPMPDKEETIEWNGNGFKKMKNLKILIIRNGKFSKDPNYLPESLRVLEWRRYSSNCLPSNFHPEELLVCKLHDGCFTSFHGLSKKFVHLTVLNFDNCQYLTEIPDVSNLPNLVELSFKWCWDLITVHKSVGFLNNLKILNANNCSKLTSFPPLHMTSLEKLELSYCSSLENFPEISGKMENIRHLELRGLPIIELPSSFENFIGLQILHLQCEIVKLRSSIAMMSELSLIYAQFCKWWQWVKSEEAEENVDSIVTEKNKWFSAECCNLNDDFFSIGFKQFALVTKLDLSGNNFTFLPGYIKECQFLWSLEVNNCKLLQEIRGIPPKLQYFFAINCKSLTSSSISMFLNQELHEARSTKFYLPGAWIPEWFDHQSRGPLISFWFRNKFPAKVLCLLVAPVKSYRFPLVRPVVFINDKVQEYSQWASRGRVEMLELDQTYLFDLQKLPFDGDLSELPLENGWNHVEVTYAGVLETSIIKALGIHVFKQESSIEDIRFTDPNRKRKLDDYLNNSESQNGQLLKKRRIVDSARIVSWSCLLNSACSYFHLFLLKQSSHCAIL